MYHLVEFDEDRASVAHTSGEVEPWESPEEVVWGEEMAEIEAMETNWVDAEEPEEIREIGVHEVFMALLAAVVIFALFLLASCRPVTYEDCSGEILNAAGEVVLTFSSLCGM